MKQMNFFLTKKKQTYRPRNQTYGYQRGSIGASDRLSGWLSSKEYICQCRRMQETQEMHVRFLSQEDSPGGGNDNQLQYSCWRIPWTEEPSLAGYSP